MTRERMAWTAGVIGALGSAVTWVVIPASFPHAWLAAFVCWLAWPLGSLALLLVHALTGGRWGVLLRPCLAAGLATLPLAVPFAVPLAFVLGALYPWATPGAAAHLRNGFYLNSPFFAARGLLYLVLWLGTGGVVLRALRSGGYALRRLAPLALIALAFSFTFAAIDLTMSLDPAFASSVYGMMAGSEAVLFALSVAVFGGTFGITAASDGLADLGKLMLALLIFWVYLDFMQVLIVWQSDLPDEAAWYLPRIAGEWGFAAGAIALMHMLLPFFVLLSPRWQRRPRVLNAVAAMLIAGEVLRAWWLVLPAAGRGVGVTDVMTMLTVFGLGAGAALRFGRMPALAAVMRND